MAAQVCGWRRGQKKCSPLQDRRSFSRARHISATAARSSVCVRVCVCVCIQLGGAARAAAARRASPRQANIDDVIMACFRTPHPAFAVRSPSPSPCLCVCLCVVVRTCKGEREKGGAEQTRVSPHIKADTRSCVLPPLPSFMLCSLQCVHNVRAQSESELRCPSPAPACGPWWHTLDHCVSVWKGRRGGGCVGDLL